MIHVRNVASALLPIVLCVALLGAIYFTLFDWEWTAFLSGIFVAAVLALTSRASSAEWRVARRNAQIRKLKKSLSRQTEKYQHADQLLAETKVHMSLLMNVASYPILYANRDQICRQHNESYARMVRLPAEKIDGAPLKDLLGGTLHTDARQWLEHAQAGESVRFLQNLRLGDLPPRRYDARLVATSNAGGNVTGFYVMLHEDPGAQRGPSLPGGKDDSSTPDQSQEPHETVAPDNHSAAGQDHFFRSMSDDLTGWDDPRARFMEALERDQFLLLYQSIVPAVAGRAGPHYCEILIRLQEEEQKILPPGTFFLVAERYHLMPELDRWVVRNLLRWYWTGHDAANPPRFCINLSADTIADTSFQQFLISELEASRVPASALCFEIAEADVLANRGAAVRFSNAAATMGSEIIIDGFASTCASFVYLHDMAVDFLKIDGSIIGSLVRDKTSVAKVRAIIRAADLTNRKTIAEFVESKETLEILRGLGVDYVQGFGIAHPRPLAEFTQPVIPD